MLGRFGQTLGKMFCKVIVLDLSEARLTYKQAVLRDIIHIVVLVVILALNIPRILQGIDVSSVENFTSVDWMMAYFGLAVFALELVTMFTNTKRRSLHDFIAGSVVIRKIPKTAEQAPAINAAS